MTTAATPEPHEHPEPPQSLQPPQSRLPTPADEDRLWALIEQAWTPASDAVNAARRALTTRPRIDDGVPAIDDTEGRRLMLTVDGAADAFIATLTGLCADMSSETLTDLDRVVERKLYDLDREDVHAVTDGSDDGFLYARGFILAVGRDYYTAVDADPRLAVIDCDLEAMCYLFASIHEKKYGTDADTGSGISRETCFNPTGWGAD